MHRYCKCGRCLVRDMRAGRVPSCHVDTDPAAVLAHIMSRDPRTFRFADALQAEDPDLTDYMRLGYRDELARLLAMADVATAANPVLGA